MFHVVFAIAALYVSGRTLADAVGARHQTGGRPILTARELSYPAS